MQLAVYKDISELHCNHPDDFLPRFNQAKQNAKLVTESDIEKLGKPHQETGNIFLLFPFTDAGTAELLAKLYGDKFCFDVSSGKWLIYDGVRWNISKGDAEIYKIVIKIARDIHKAALDATSSEQREAATRYALRLESSAKIASVLKVASALMAKYSEDFDRDQMLLNCLNGTLDLRTGILRPHNPADMITKVATVNYDPDAKCNRWDQFLMEIMDGNEVLISYLYRLMGMCLTGLVQEQILPIFYGTGANGKSVFLDVITGLMGEYSTEAPPELLEEKKCSDHPAGVADAFGRRLVVASETEENAVLKIQLVKRLTGNAKIKARFMRQDFFEFTRTHKMILVTNNKPVVNEKTNAVWRRLRLIPFDVTIPDNEQDKSLLRKLENEYSGILNKLLDGCLEWQEIGLQEPTEIEEATWEYRAEQDPLGDFVEDCCRMDSFSVTPVNLLKENFEAWQQETGRRYHLSARSFNDSLRKYGCKYETRYFDGESQKCWIGIDLCKNLTEPY